MSTNLAIFAFRLLRNVEPHQAREIVNISIQLRRRRRWMIPWQSADNCVKNIGYKVTS